MQLLKSAVIAIATLVSTGANAAVLTEGFDAPFAGWESRWFGTQTNTANYYVSEPGGSDPTYQGAPDVTGLWLSDGDNYLSGGNYGEIGITFDKAFGVTLTAFSMDVATALPSGAALTFFDIDGASIGSFLVPVSPTSAYYTPTGYNTVAVTSINGIGGFRFTGFAQGNTIVDNLRATTSASAVPEPATWALMIGGLGLVGAAMRRRTTAVRYA